MSDSSAASQAGRIVVRCTCGKKLGAPLQAAGKAIKCPKCGQRVPVPRSGASATPRSKPLPSAGRAAAARKSAASASGAADGRIKVVCTCGKKIRVPASGAGKKGKCPACGAFFRVPQPEKKPKPPTLPREQDIPRPPLLEDEPEPSTTLNLLDEGSTDDELGGGLFGELEVQSSTGARSPGVVTAVKCPHCHGMIPSNAERCPLCNNNPAKPPKVKKSKQRGGSMGDKLSGAGSALAALSLGTLYSCSGATIGAAIWVAVAWATEFELGYIAWILGGLTGYGMVFGTKSQSVIAGLTASVVAFFAILVAKIAIIFIVLFPQIENAVKAAAGMEVLPSPEEFAEMRREMIVEDTESELESMGHDPYARRTPQYYEDHAVVHKKHQDELDTWSDKKIIEEYERRQEESKSKFAESMEDYQRAKVAAYLAGQELEAEGVDDEAEDYFKQRAERSEVKQKEMESWSKEKFEEEFAKCEAAEEAEYNREELAGYLAEEELERLGIEDHMPAYDDRYSEIQVEKEKELESWSVQRVATELESYEKRTEEEFAASSPGLGDVPASEWALLFILFFDPMGLFITLIAMGTAFWVGYGGFERV